MKHKHFVVHPDGTECKRESATRFYTHAIVLFLDGQQYGVRSWHQSLANAQKALVRVRKERGMGARTVSLVEVTRVETGTAMWCAWRWTKKAGG